VLNNFRLKTDGRPRIAQTEDPGRSSSNTSHPGNKLNVYLNEVQALESQAIPVLIPAG
jgi:hypothetical protein